MRYDREVAFQFVLSEYFHHCAHYIPVLFWNEREFVLEAVKQDGRALGYASEELRTDREVVLEAMKNGGSLYEASKELSNDPELRKLAGWDE